MKKQLFLLAAILAMASSTPAWAYDFSAVAPSGQTLYYNIVNGSAQVTYQNSSSPSYSNLTGALTIPSSVTYNGTTYTVTSIGNYAFRYCTGLTSVTIPNSVTSISDGAFSGCSGLTSVTIPNSVTTIGDYAFFGVRHIEYYGNATGSPWGAISMNGITEGDFVFSDATKQVLLAYSGAGGSVVIPSTVETIGSSAFYGCTGLTSVTIPNSVTSIGDYAFYGCSGLTSVTIPNSVVSIGEGAFCDCWELTSVIIPSSVTSIGVDAFYNVRHIEYYGNAAGSPWGAISMNGVTEGDFVYSDATKHVLLAYIGAGGNAVIPSTVETIGTKAFYGCTGLTSVTIPNSVTSIGDGAFYYCIGLTSVTIPNSVTSISDGAFSGCSGLTSVTIPNSVTSIGISAFYNCSGLTSVTIPNSVTSIGNYAFYNCSGLTSITIPNSVTSIGNHAFYGCSGLTSFTIGSGVTSIGVRALGDCTGLRNIISKAVYPPTASDNTFENVPPSCKLTVPCGSLQYYQVTPLWNTQFPLMEEDCNPDGIDDTEIGDVMVYAANGMIYISSTLPTETTIFDITGHQVAAFTAEAASIPLPAGVYLVKIGAYPARKVVVIR